MLLLIFLALIRFTLNNSKSDFMKSTVVGPYPRVGSEYGSRLRKELNRFYRGEGDEKLIGQLKEDLTREVLQEMVSAGIDLPHYGLTDVHDELTWPLEVEGIDFGGMKKTFHTNIHYREAVVNGEVKRLKRIVSPLHDVAAREHPNTKIEVPGPYTMAKHSVLDEDAPYKNLKNLAIDYAILLSTELSEFEDVPLIQFDEPSIIAYGKDHGDMGIVPELYQEMLRNVKVPTAVWTFYGFYSPDSLKPLFSLPVDVVGLDFVWDPNVADLLQVLPYDKGIGIGIIDSGDRGYIGLENKDEVIEKVRKLKGLMDLDKSYISNNAALEHLPRDVARQKLVLIGEIARGVSE